MQNTFTFSKATHWLFYSICAYFLMNGAQLWETALMVPAWTVAPPSSLIVFQKPYALDLRFSGLSCTAYMKLSLSSLYVIIGK